MVSTFLCSRRNRARGFFVPALVTVFLVIIFIAVLFGTRLKSRFVDAEVRHSERYYELVEMDSRDAQQQAELEFETCRYRRNVIEFLRRKKSPDYESTRTGYETTCAEILPLQTSSE